MRRCEEGIRCPECSSENVIKDGKLGGKQRYLCKKCHRRFTPEAKHIFRPKHFKERAIKMYVNGMSINAIAKTLGVPFSTVYGWIKKARQIAETKYLHKL